CGQAARHQRDRLAVVALADDARLVAGRRARGPLPAHVVSARQVDAVLQYHRLVVDAGLRVDPGAPDGDRATRRVVDRLARGLVGEAARGRVRAAGRHEDAAGEVAVDAVAVVVGEVAVGLVGGRRRRALAPAGAAQARARAGALAERRGDV